MGSRGANSGRMAAGSGNSATQERMLNESAAQVQKNLVEYQYYANAKRQTDGTFLMPDGKTMTAAEHDEAVKSLRQKTNNEADIQKALGVDTATGKIVKNVPMNSAQSKAIAPIIDNVRNGTTLNGKAVTYSNFNIKSTSDGLSVTFDMTIDQGSTKNIKTRKTTKNPPLTAKGGALIDKKGKVHPYSSL